VRVFSSGQVVRILEVAARTGERRCPPRTGHISSTEEVVPKSKVRKKVAVQTSRSATAAVAAAAPRTHVAGPSGPVYIGIMLGLMLLGLAWLVVYYLWGQDIGFMATVGNWNFGIGFALMIAGLLMTMRWR
jgi:hypothetical protein